MVYFNVSKRIVLGFASVVVLSIVICIVAFRGNMRIETSVSRVTEQNVPALMASYSLLKNVLETQIILSNIDSVSDSKVLSEMSKQVQSLKTNADSAFAIINETNLNNQQIATLSTQASNAKTLFFGSAEQAMRQSEEAIEAALNSSRAAREFGDLADETLSFADDLQGLSEDKTLNKKIDDVVNQINLVVNLANQGLKSSMVLEIERINTQLGSKIQSIENTLQSLASEPQLQSDEAIEATTAINENFIAFKNILLGSKSALKARITYLNQTNDSKQATLAATESANALKEHIKALENTINELTIDSKAFAFSTITNSIIITSILAFLTVVLSAAIAMYVIRSIRSPLARFALLLRQASKGDFTVSFTGFKNDEFGLLSQDLQSLLKILSQLIAEIINNTNTLATTAEETSTIAEQNCAAAADQNHQMHQMCLSIAEMKQTVGAVAESIQQALCMVQSTNTTALDCDKTLDNNIKEMGKLDSSIASSASAIETLNAQLESINTILSDISSIAEQTNLLALNAAIEAARAGEQGRGFAVVADEVRTLASRSRDATEEIEQAICNLQVGAKQAVEMMQRSQQQTQACVLGIDSVKVNLNTIVNSIGTIKEMSEQIATATEQQNVTAEHQYQSVEKLMLSAEQSNANAENTSEASAQLTEMAESLRLKLANFKV